MGTFIKIIGLVARIVRESPQIVQDVADIVKAIEAATGKGGAPGA